MDAWAVLAETEAVGGPEEKMDRLGLLNKDEDGCVDCVVEGICRGLARSSSGAGCCW